ncbi:MAG: hypothetical protein ACJ70S_05870, partial [Nitrososphaera sp.]
SVCMTLFATGREPFSISGEQSASLFSDRKDADDFRCCRRVPYNPSGMGDCHDFLLYVVISHDLNLKL